MKGFKSTGKGPRYGNFAFPSKAGFGPSGGGVKSVSGYTRRAPKRKAIGGLVTDGIVEAPGFSDFAKGGRVAGVSDPMPAKEALSSFSKGGKASKNWIAGAVKKPGALRRTLGVSKGKDIPEKKLEAATHSRNPKTRRRAQLAETFRSFNK